MLKKQIVIINFTKLAMTLLLMLSLTSCFGTTNEHLGNIDQNTEKLAKEVEAYRDYVKAVSEEMKRLNDTLSSFQKMSAQIFNFFMEALTQKSPAPQTPDIGDYIEADVLDAKADKNDNQ